MEEGGIAALPAVAADHAASSIEGPAADVVTTTPGVEAAGVALTEDVDRVLTPDAAARVARGYAENTRRAYAHDWEAFTTWCADTGRTALPATAETLTNYVARLTAREKPLAPATIDRAVACVLARHDAAEKPKPATKAARLVLRDYRRQRAEDGIRQRKAPPITLPILRQMIDATPTGTIAGLRDRALLVIGFALMGRRSEIAALDIADLLFDDMGIDVLIRMSKTDRDAKGEITAIPYGSHPATCPVRVVRAWINTLAEHNHTAGPLLRPVDRWDRLAGHPRAAGDRARTDPRLSGEGINLIVHRAAARAGLPHAETYTAHSLRAGGATAAARAGASMTAIARHGRWTETSPTVHGYIRSASRWDDNPMQAVGL